MAKPAKPDPARAGSESDVTAALDGKLKSLKERRYLPILALISLSGLLLSSSAGVAFSVIVVVFGLRLPGDTLSRVFVFASSVVGLLYVFVHIVASRRRFVVTQHGPPWLYGNHLHSAALILSRLGFAAWIGSVITTSLLISALRGNFRNANLARQTINVNLVVSTLALYVHIWG
jgi:hypothetical protein